MISKPIKRSHTKPLCLHCSLFVLRVSVSVCVFSSIGVPNYRIRPPPFADTYIHAYTCFRVPLQVTLAILTSFSNMVTAISSDQIVATSNCSLSNATVTPTAGNSRYGPSDSLARVPRTRLFGPLMFC